MPEIVPALSWGFIRLAYQTPNYAHHQKIHIAELNPSTGAWLNPRTDSYPETYLLDTLDNYISLAHSVFVTGTTFSTVEVYQNQAGALPAIPVATFMVSVPSTAPSGIHTAGGQYTFTFGSTVQQKAKFVFMDTWSGQPQRYAFSEIAANLQTWVNYILGAGDQIVTRDGYAVQFMQSLSSNLNRANVRRYGRYDTP